MTTVKEMDNHSPVKTEIEGIVHSKNLTFPLDITIRALDSRGELSESVMKVGNVDDVVKIIQTDSLGKLSFHVRAGDVFLYPKLTPPTSGPSRIQLPDELRGEVRIDSSPTMGPLDQYSHLPPGGAFAQPTMPSLADFNAAFGHPPSD